MVLEFEYEFEMQVRSDWLTNVERNDTCWMRAGVFYCFYCYATEMKYVRERLFLDDCRVVISVFLVE